MVCGQWHPGWAGTRTKEGPLSATDEGSSSDGAPENSIKTQAMGKGEARHIRLVTVGSLAFGPYDVRASGNGVELADLTAGHIESKKQAVDESRS